MNFLHLVAVALEANGPAVLVYAFASFMVPIACAIREVKHPISPAVGALTAANLAVAMSLCVAYGIACLCLNVAWQGFDWIAALETIGGVIAAIALFAVVVRGASRDLDQWLGGRFGGLG